MKSIRSVYAVAAVVAIALAAAPLADAAIVQKMNLDALCGAAGSIARVTVESVEPSTIAVQGGEIPTLVYTLSIREPFKGLSPEQIRRGTMTLTMLDPTRVPRSKVGSNIQHLAVLPDLPVLEPGGEYLLLTTQPSSGGLATTVGLAQGSFRILEGDAGQEWVRNGIDNIGLFDGMTVRKALNTSNLTYGQITDVIRTTVGENL